VLDVLVPEIVLQGARVVAIIGQFEPAGMAKHVRVDWEWHLGDLPQALDEQMEPNGTDWPAALTGNPAGRLRGSRNRLSEEVICALLRDFREHGQKAIAKVRREQPGVYLKVLALLIPRQDKLEHTNTIKTMTDEELESAIAFLHEMMAAQAVGSAHLVEMKAEPAALPAPGGQSPGKLSSKRKPNRLMMEVNTAIGPQERKPRKHLPRT
jgi:hypothetical protein